MQETVKNHVGRVLLREDLSTRVIHVENKKKKKGIEMESVGRMNMGTVFPFLRRAFGLQQKQGRVFEICSFSQVAQIQPTTWMFSYILVESFFYSLVKLSLILHSYLYAKIRLFWQYLHRFKFSLLKLYWDFKIWS